MSSQMLWLLSCVSLGLALTLGNRASGIRGSSSSSSSLSALSQQQKQQSTSSSVKMRQESRSSRDETSRIFRPGEAGSVLVKLDNLASYRYDELPIEFAAERNFRGKITGAEDDDDEDDEDDERIGVKDTRDNPYLDEFAIAVLDTLYPRNRDLLVAGKPPNPRFNDNGDNERSILSNHGVETSPRGGPRLAFKTRTITPDLPRKMTKSPIVIYRPDRTLQTSIPYDDPGKPVPRVRQTFDDARNPVEWPLNNDNELTARTIGGERLTKRRDNDNDQRWNVGDDEIVNSARKRDDVGRGRSVNSKSPGGWNGNGQQSQPSTATNPGASIASQFLLRSARGNRQYDVPQIECPASEDGMERFACPTPDRMGRYRCIDDHVLCDGFIDCPTAEDEDRQACMFYKTTKAHLDVLADALLRWARGR